MKIGNMPSSERFFRQTKPIWRRNTWCIPRKIGNVWRKKSRRLGMLTIFKRALNTMNISNSMIDQLAALDQAESHFRSENIKFGIRHRMRSGKTVLNHTQFLGYTKGPDGVLQVVPEEAEIVRKIFELYIQGNGVRRIKRYLEECGIKTVTGKAEWSTSTIDRMLSNEKYVGEVRMQKTFTADFLTGRREKNIGQLASYLVGNAHEPIIDREIFELVQEIKRKHDRSPKPASNIELC